MKIYESAQSYFEGPDEMKNEVTMWFVAGGLLLQELSKKLGNLPFGGLKEKVGYEESKKLQNVSVLDLCSGPGNFVNHLAFIYSNLNVVCIDKNPDFVRSGNEIFKKWKFIEGDVLKINLNQKFDFVITSSAYHHIQDENKIDFLKTIHRYLVDDGVAIICENFLPDYKNDSDRKISIKKYYDELEQYYRDGNATKKAVEIVKEVREQELNSKEEHKVSFRIFEEHLAKTGLKIDNNVIIWQPDIFKYDKAGSH
ncbi:MAG: hypothetical protein A3D40_02435, partial [Parcubacteria group bacterium RIFCSPHIGHO2_02_FULL_40_12]